MQTHRETSTASGSREALLDAAKSLFSLHGFEGVSVKEISSRAGVNVGLISYYFGNKAGIYRQCLAEAGQHRLAAAKRILTPPQSWVEVEIRLQLFIEEMLDTYLRDPDQTGMVYRECEKSAAEFESVFRETYLEAFKTIERFLQSAIKRKLLRQDLNAEIAASLLISQVVHATRMDQVNFKYFGKKLSNSKYRESFVRHVVSIFMQGVSENAAEGRNGSS